MFVCENPNCGINNATGEYGEHWDEEYEGVTVPVRTYMEHTWSTAEDGTRVSTATAADGCVGGYEHLCTVCNKWYQEANAGHEYAYALIDRGADENGVHSFNVVATCTVEGCTVGNKGHEVTLAEGVTETNSSGALTHTGDEQTCYKEVTWTFTYKGTHSGYGTAADGSFTATCPVVMPMEEHVFYYNTVDGKQVPVYASDLLESEGTAWDDLSASGIIDADGAVAGYYKVDALSGYNFLDITEYSNLLKDYRDYDAVCGPAGEASVGLAYFYCADPACEAAHDGIPAYTIIPVYRTHIVDENAEDTKPGSTPATCTTPGTISGTCTVCGQTGVEDETEALDHDYVYKFATIKGQTYDEDTGAGQYTMTVTCSRHEEVGCGFTEVSGTVNVTNVDLDELLCTNDDPTAKTTYTYTVASVVDATTTGKALADLLGTLPADFTMEKDEVFHELANGDLIVEGGTFTFSTDEELTASGITESTEAVCGPTATPGAGTFTCEACDEKNIPVVTVREHNYDEGVTTPATCEEAGKIVSTCLTCSATVTQSGDKDLVDEMNKDQAKNGKWEYNEDLAPLGHHYVRDELVDPTLEEDGYAVYNCDREGCDTNEGEAATQRVTLPQIQESWFTDANNKVDGSNIEGAITAGYTKFEQTTLLTCGQSAMYDVVFSATLPNGSETSYPITFTFIREPDADLHTFGDSPYYLVRHYEHGLLLTAVGKFCDSCQQFVAEQNFVGNGVEITVDEDGKLVSCLDADKKALPVYVSKVVDSANFGTWATSSTDVSIYADTSITLEATYGADRTNVYNGVVFRILSGNTEMYFVRSGGDSAVLPGWIWGGDYTGTDMTQPGQVSGDAATAVRTAESLTIKVSLDSETDTMTIVYTSMDEDGDVTNTLTYTITGMAADSYTLSFANDPATTDGLNNGSTLEGNVHIYMGA